MPLDRKNVCASQAPRHSFEDVSRRNLLQRATVLAGGAVLLAASVAAPTSKADTGKLSQQAAAYQTSPKNGQRCTDCALFIAPASCKLVDGAISPAGWCKLFGAGNLYGVADDGPPSANCWRRAMPQLCSRGRMLPSAEPREIRLGAFPLAAVAPLSSNRSRWARSRVLIRTVSSEVSRSMARKSRILIPLVPYQTRPRELGTTRTLGDFFQQMEGAQLRTPTLPGRSPRQVLGAAAYLPTAWGGSTESKTAAATTTCIGTRPRPGMTWLPETRAATPAPGGLRTVS